MSQEVGASSWLFVKNLDNPELDETDLSYLIKVKRVRVGERLSLCDGKGSHADFAITSVSQRPLNVELESLGPISIDPEPAYRVGVALHMPKLDRLSWAVQKLSEVGVDDLYLISSENDRRGGRTPSEDRMIRVSRGASAQARRSRLPAIHAMTGLDQLLGDEPRGVAICNRTGRPPHVTDRIFVIGPESGVIDVKTELDYVKLPGLVLRVETAAVVAGAILIGMRDGIVGQVSE